MPTPTVVPAIQYYCKLYKNPFPCKVFTNISSNQISKTSTN